MGKQSHRFWMWLGVLPSAILLLLAGLSKAIDVAPIGLVLDSAGLPEAAVVFTTWVLPPLEIALGVSLLLGWWSRALLACSIGLMSFFSVFLVYLHLIGSEISCGCFATAIGDFVGTTPIVGAGRNVVLIVFLVPATLWVWRGKLKRRDSKQRTALSTTAQHVMLLVALIMACHWTPRAWAQMPIVPWDVETELPWVSTITPAVLKAVIADCQMDETQQELARLFYEENRKRFLQFVREGKQEQRKIRSEIDGLATNKLKYQVGELHRREVMGEWADRQQQIDKDLLTEWKTLLYDNQLVHWDFFEQRWCRMKWLGRGFRYSEEQLDLIKIVEDLELGSEDVADVELFRETLLAYARDVDLALKARVSNSQQRSRNEWKEELQRLETNGIEAWTGSGGQPLGYWMDRARQHARKTMKLHETLRKVNRRYRASLGGLLTNRAQDFHDACQNAASGDWLNPLYMRGIEYAHRLLESSELDESQIQQITQLLDSHMLQARALSKKIVRVRDELVEEQFEIKGSDRIKKQKLRSEIEEVKQKRYEIEDRLVKLILLLLTEKQLEKYPRPKPMMDMVNHD